MSALSPLGTDAREEVQRIIWECIRKGWCFARYRRELRKYGEGLRRGLAVGEKEWLRTYATWRRAVIAVTGTPIRKLCDPRQPTLFDTPRRTP